MPGFEIIGEEERRAVNEVFDDGACLFRHSFDFMRKTKRFRVAEFEKTFAEYLGLPHAQAVTSGTTALFAVNKALGIKTGDEVITQSFTFVATVEAIWETGATPVVTEVDKTLNMDPVDLEKKITPKTKAIWVVPMMGAPARMQEILEIARKHRIPVLEDTAQGLGATYGGQLCGTLGLAGTFSFDFGKTLTTGEGGMVATRDKELFLKLKAYADHGHEDNPAFPRGEDTASGSGLNLRMMELQGAIGCVQLKKLPDALNKIRDNYSKLYGLLKDLPNIEFREIPKTGALAGDTLVFFLKNKTERVKISDFLASKGVGFKLLPGALKWHFAGRWDHIWKDIPAYAGKRPIELWPRSFELLERAIALPIMIQMTNEKIEQVANAVKEGIRTLT